MFIGQVRHCGLLDLRSIIEKLDQVSAGDYVKLDGVEHDHVAVHTGQKAVSQMFDCLTQVRLRLA